MTFLAKVNSSTKAKGTTLSGVSSYKQNETVEVYSLVQKRFFLLSLLIPLSFAANMVTSTIYGKKLAEKYSVCLLGAPNGTVLERCIYDLPDPGWVVGLLNWTISDLCVFAIVAYFLIPKSGRVFWLKLWRKCKDRQVRQRYDDTTECPSEVTRLFPSSSFSKELYSATENSAHES